MLAAQWPFGLICCFGILAFLIVSSVILALIPIYLPTRTATIQTQANNRLTYIEYEATATDGYTGLPSNIQEISAQYKNQLGYTNDLVKVEGVQVIPSTSARRKRRSLKRSFNRHKRAILTFRILIYVRITFPDICRADKCHQKWFQSIHDRCSARKNILLQFIFLAFSRNYIRYSLLFIGFYFAVPSIYFNNGQSSVTATTSTSIATTETTTTYLSTASEILGNTDNIGDTTDGTASSTTTDEILANTDNIGDATDGTASSTTTDEILGITGDLVDCTEENELTTTTSTTTTTVLVGDCTDNVRQGLEWFSLYGLITIEDFSTTSNVKNRAIVCGSYTSSQSGDFGESVTTNPSPTNFTLQINGNLVSGNPINMNKGSLGLGTNPSHTISSSSNTQATVDGRLINLNQGNEGANARVDQDLSDTCQSITTSLLALSQRLSQLSNTSGNTIDLPGSQPSGANININAIDGNGISVISLDGNTLLNNNNVQSIQIVIDSSVSSDLKLVVINLSGTSITFGGGSNLGGSWLQSSEGRSRTIWNLYEATTFNNNNGKAWMGSTLAPNAAMTQNGQTTGTVAVKTLTSSASIDSPLVIVPECI